METDYIKNVQPQRNSMTSKLNATIQNLVITLNHFENAHKNLIIITIIIIKDFIVAYPQSGSSSTIKISHNIKKIISYIL